MAAALSAAGFKSLSPAKRAALEKLLLARRDAQSAADRIPKADPAAAAELSFAERRLWLLDKLEPNHPFYNMPLAARVIGSLDRAALAKSLRRLCDRHETLRYAYKMVDGLPERRVCDVCAVEPEFVDLPGVAHDSEGLRAKLREEARRPFDLNRPPLLRCVVFELGSQERVILLTMHHIVSDGWSMWVMLNDLSAEYDAARHSGASPLAPLAVQYSDYAVWQRERMTGERKEELVEYWREQFADAPPMLELPIDHARPAAQDFDGAVQAFRLPDDVGQLLKQRADATGATPFMLLMAAYQAWLSRYTGQRDLMVGTVVANRVRAELESLIGFFVNTLAVRGDLSHAPTFGEFAENIRAKSLDAFAHQELPFDQLIEAVAPERDQSHAALFQTALVVQNPPRDFARGEGIQIEPLPVDNGTAKYDLTFFFWEDEQGWVGQAEYRASLFEGTTIERFIASFQTLLRDALQNPDKPCSRLEVLDPTQREQLAAWNDTAHPFPPPHVLHEMFEAQAERRASHVAIRDAGESITYGELASRVARCAAGLLARGVKAGDAVVIALPRSADQITAMLAALKSGGIYTPVDPEQSARLDYVVEHSAARVVVGADSISAPAKTTVVSLEELLTAGERAMPSDPGVAPEDLAYTIFTSGSTGQPKGVQVEHRSLANFVRAQVKKLGVSEDDRIVHAMSPSFDGGVSEVFLALGIGATVVVVDRQTTLDPAALTDTLQRERVTEVKFPPALLAVLDPEKLPGLRTVSSVADTLLLEVTRKWLPGRRMFNGYGPTEATVGVSMHELCPPVEGPPPIGPPMANMRAYVLDEHGQQTPIGAAGEIHIGGAGVARGYLNKPEETAKRFLPDPFSPAADARMYRTGDIGRWNDEGELEFLGRVDDQVQLRGYRVEPGEVGAALERLPQVDQACVTVKPDPRGEQRLVAYVVPSEEGLGDGQGEENHVDAWQALMEGSHRAAGALRDVEFDTTGWVSSFTGLPIPKEEMREWADAAVARVLALGPKNVLEIGCGTGLILLPTAPHCESYVGTDFLERSLQQLQEVVDRREDLAKRVELLPLAADQLGRLKGRTFDTIVMNSVAQYFPSSDYLLRVIRLASDLLAPGGRMFLGDLRNLRLHEALAASVEINRADVRLSRRELLGRVEAQLRREEELLIDPALFDALRAELPRLTHAEVQLKQGDARNELIRFRYDVVLHFDGAAASGEPDVTRSSPTTSEELTPSLTDLPKSVLIANQPNPRVVNDVQVWTRLSNDAIEPTVEEVKQQIRSEATGVDPDSWRQLASEHNYQAEIRWGETPDCYDVWLYQEGCVVSPRTTTTTDLAHFANQPMQQKLIARLGPELRAGLAETLPQYMLPTAFVVLDALPRTPNGKVDRDALPPPPTGRPAWATGYVAPRDDEERLIAEVWEQLLGISPVGAEDNFFDLGGHSMLAVQVMAEIEARAGRSIPLAALFQDPTVQNLAALLRDPQSAQAGTTLVPLQTTGDSAPLLCIHPAGGAVFCYQALAAHFAGERPVIGVQAHGVDGLQEPHETMEAMADAYVDAIRARRPEGPYHLCGWSLGGNIAYEVARRLKDEGQQVGLVGLFDAGAIPPEESFEEEDLLPLLEALFPDTEHATLEEVRGMTPDQQIAFFTERAAKAGLVDPAQLAASQHIFTVFQNNVSAVHKHTALPYPGPVTLFRAGEQTKTNQLFDDPELGWGPLVPSVRVLEVPSDHAQMMNPPQVDTLAEMVKRELRILEDAKLAGG